MPCSSTTDAHGTTYTIPAAETLKTPGRRVLLGLPALEVWWSRNGKAADARSRADETIIIRQEYADRPTADVLELTLGQTYDLIDGLTKAVEDI